MNENVHKVYLADEYAFVRETVATKDYADGVRLTSGKRAGSDSTEGICYEFNPAKFSLGTALSWMETKGIQYTSAMQAQPVAKFSSPSIRRFWFEACRVGKWKSFDAGGGKPGVVDITRPLLMKAVDWVKSGRRPKNKLTHEDQAVARDLFGPDGMGEIVDAKLRDDGVMELETAMPERTHKFFADGWVKKPSVELFTDGALDSVAFLGFAQPAAKGLADVQMRLAEGQVIEPHTFAPPAIRTAEGELMLLQEADTDPGSPDATGGENEVTESASTTQAQNEPDSKEMKMAEDLKPALLKMAAGRIDDALARGVTERRLEPGQVEGERTSLVKLSEATYTNPDILDSAIAAIHARPQMAEKNKGKADPAAVDTSKALEITEDKRPATIKLQAAAQKFVDDKAVETFEEGWIRSANEHPDWYVEHNKASYRLRGADEVEEVAR